MKTVTEMCPGLEHPERIRGTKLRKYLATTAQVSRLILELKLHIQQTELNASIVILFSNPLVIHSNK